MCIWWGAPCFVSQFSLPTFMWVPGDEIEMDTLVQQALLLTKPSLWLKFKVSFFFTSMYLNGVEVFCFSMHIEVRRQLAGISFSLHYVGPRG